MTPSDTPALDARYWIALAAASALGTNTGDVAAHDLRLGHAGGLVPLFTLFALILWGETRAARATVLFYWLAIVVLRTAATNLADLLTHDLSLSGGHVVATLALLLVALVAADRDRSRRHAATDKPRVGALYWTTMLVAGVFGTAAGDALADELGAGPAALLTLPLFALLLAGRAAGGWRMAASSWIVVAAARTAGTNIGDWLAEDAGLGLALATALTATVFVATLVLWRPGGTSLVRPPVLR